MLKDSKEFVFSELTESYRFNKVKQQTTAKKPSNIRMQGMENIPAQSVKNTTTSKGATK